MTETRAVVFAYHNVGYQCLKVLLAHKLDVRLVVTHTDNPAETIWFESVAKLAAAHGVPVITPEDPNTPETIARIRALQPDFLFSFYYRNMLSPALLAVAPPRRAQHARLAAAQISRARAGELGGHQRRK